MTAAEIISLLGVIAALAGLAFFVLKGVNNYLMAFVATVLIALTSRLSVYETLVKTYMGGFTGYIAQWFIVFYAGALFGKLMADCGAAETVAHGLVKIVGKKLAPIAPIIAGAIMGYGGITTFVIGFCVVPIAVQIFRDANLPRRLIPGAIFIGPTIAMVAPGSPQIANIVCSTACETNFMGGGIAGWIADLVFGLGTVCVLYLWMIKRAVAKGEYFIPKAVDNITKENDNKEQPGMLTSILPLLITVVAINIPNGQGGNLIPTEYGLLLDCLSIIVLNLKFFDKQQIVPALGDGFKTAITIIGNTAAIVGIGAVVKATPMFEPVVARLTSGTGNPYVGGALSIALLAGILGSASGSTSLGAPLLAPAFIAQGADPGMLARVMCMASSTLDSLPHSGAVVSTIDAMCHEEYKGSYGCVFMLTVVGTTVMTLSAIIMAMLFY